MRRHRCTGLSHSARGPLYGSTRFSTTALTATTRRRIFSPLRTSYPALIHGRALAFSYFAFPREAAVACRATLKCEFFHARFYFSSQTQFYIQNRKRDFFSASNRLQRWGWSIAISDFGIFVPACHLPLLKLYFRDNTVCSNSMSLLWITLQYRINLLGYWIIRWSSSYTRSRNFTL